MLRAEPSPWPPSVCCFMVVVVQASDLTNELNQLKVTSTPPTQTEAGRLAVPGLSRRLPIAQTDEEQYIILLSH